MMMRYNSHNNLQTVTRTAIVAAFLSLLVCCIREPELHLFDGGEVDIDLPLVELELDAYWDYEIAYGITYDWRAEWAEYLPPAPLLHWFRAYGQPYQRGGPYRQR